MMRSLINYIFYPLKKGGRLKWLFSFYRSYVISKNKINFIVFSFIEKYFPHKFNFNSLIDYYLETINFIIENEIKFDFKKLNLLVKKSDILYLDNIEAINKNPFNFYQKYIQIKNNTLDLENYLLLKKKYFEILSKMQNSNDFNRKNIRFIRAKDIFNTIGLSYITDITLKSCMLGLIPNYKFICLVHNEFKNKAINDFYIKKISKYINFIYDENLIKKYKKYESLFDIHQNEFYKFENNLYLYTQSTGILVNKIWQNQNKKPLFQLSENEKKLGWKKLNKIGIKKNDWFVCVHVRDDSFKGRENHRDANIRDYFPAFEEIINAGGWVIRIGKDNNKRMPNIKNIIDYPFSNIKSDFMDIFLSTQCKFMIGTSSGMSAISHIANVPIAMTNYRPLSTLYFGSKDLYLPGLLKYKNGNLLDFNTLFEKKFSMGALDGIYKNLLEVEFVENSSDEIKNLVSTMIKKLNNTNKKILKFSKNQIKINNIIKNNNTLLTDDIEFEANIPNYFLEKYKNLL